MNEAGGKDWSKIIAVPTTITPYLQEYMGLCDQIHTLPRENGVSEKDWFSIKLYIPFFHDSILQNYVFAENDGNIPDMKKYAGQLLQEATIAQEKGKIFNSKILQEFGHLSEILANAMIAGLEANSDLTSYASVRNIYDYQNINQEMKSAFAAFIRDNPDDNERSSQRYLAVHEIKRMAGKVMDILEEEDSERVTNALKAARIGHGYCLAKINDFPDEAAAGAAFFSIAEYLLASHSKGHLFGFTKTRDNKTDIYR